jgi:ADP-ribose diphosphatase
MDEDKPKVLDTRLVTSSKLFGIEEMHLRFSNGVERTFERLRTPPIAAVMMVPLEDDGDTVLMIREYGAGLEEYQLTLPKGAYEHGEDWHEAANRELKEEIGRGARELHPLKEMTLSPGYMGHRIQAVVAQGLYEESLPGDEPEPLEVVPWKLSDLERLVDRSDVTEARVIAALYMTRDYLRRG